jgi:25S rRNA (adenine2142-N1)-methyltransferase
MHTADAPFYVCFAHSSLSELSRLLDFFPFHGVYRPAIIINNSDKEIFQPKTSSAMEASRALPSASPCGPEAVEGQGSTAVNATGITPAETRSAAPAGDNLRWASLIKEQHRHLQEAVVVGASFASPTTVTFSREASTDVSPLPYEGELRVWRAALAGSEASRRLSAYATAMHHLATQYWDPVVPHTMSASINTTANSVVALPSLDARASADLLEAGPRRMYSACVVGEKRARDEEVDASRGDARGGAVSVSTNAAAAPRHYSDRLRYCLDSTASYYLGETASPSPYSDLSKSVSTCEETGERSADIRAAPHVTDNHTRQEGKPHLPPRIVPVNHAAYARLPGLMAHVVKPLRRAFFDVHGRMATGEEVGDLIYACTPHDTVLQETTESGTDVSPPPLSVVRAAPVQRLMNTHPASQAIQADSGWRRGCGTGWETALRYTLLAATLTTTTTTRARDDHVAAIPSPTLPPPLYVLDVGSCYGPFHGKCLHRPPPLLPVPLRVTSIDLAPYVGDARDAAPQDSPCPRVWQGDWLHMQFFSSEEGVSSSEQKDVRCAEEGRVRYLASSNADGLLSVAALSLESFDAVYFCLLLSYIPTPRLRFLACLHACLALKEGGLLVIVSTRTQGSRRGNWMKEWADCLSTIGFQRVQQSTQEKIVGMAFAKASASKEEHDSWETAEGRASWIRAMMATEAASRGLRIMADDVHGKTDI